MSEDAGTRAIGVEKAAVRPVQRRPMSPSNMVQTQSARRPATPATGSGTVCACGSRRYGPEPGAGWWRRIPGRLWMALIVLTAPVRAIVIVLDGLVAAAVVGVLGVAWAWWTQRITDDQVAAVLGQIGARGLSILAKAGLM